MLHAVDPLNVLLLALNITRLVESHAKEIRALTQVIHGQRKRNVIQDIPHYMRRRAASHNINRLPRAVRNKIGKVSYE